MATAPRRTARESRVRRAVPGVAAGATAEGGRGTDHPRRRTPWPRQGYSVLAGLLLRVGVRQERRRRFGWCPSPPKGSKRLKRPSCEPSRRIERTGWHFPTPTNPCDVARTPAASDGREAPLARPSRGEPPGQGSARLDGFARHGGEEAPAACPPFGQASGRGAVGGDVQASPRAEVVRLDRRECRLKFVVGRDAEVATKDRAPWLGRPADAAPRAAGRRGRHFVGGKPRAQGAIIDDPLGRAPAGGALADVPPERVRVPAGFENGGDGGHVGRRSYSSDGAFGSGCATTVAAFGSRSSSARPSFRKAGREAVTSSRSARASSDR